MKRKAILWLVLLGVSIIAAPSAAEITYEIIDLETIDVLEEDNWSHGYGINNLGQVVGQSSIEAGPVTITEVAIDPNLPTESDSIMTNTFIDFDLIAYPQMVFTNSDFEQSGMSLQLDLYFYEDGMGMGTPIESPLLEPIGILTEGFYGLTVRAYVSPNPVVLVLPELSDEYFMSFQVTPEPATVIYVKVGGTGSGTSWDDAYGDLQDALDAAAGDPNQIWVAAGTYYATSDYGLGIGDRGKHFRMKNGVAIYGGFPNSGDPDISDRDPNQYETILSGDIGVADDDSDNCYHVFYHPSGTNLDTTAILGGFTITAGNANVGTYNDPTSKGGGMYNSGSSPTVSGCAFIGNSAKQGGVMFNENSSSPTVTNCTFTGNSANYGGGMENWESSPIVVNCTITGNRANYEGGGMVNVDSNPTVTGCTFVNNSGSYAGGMSNWASNPIVSNCTFSENSADYGGGMNNSNNSSPTVSNSILWGNNASSGGNEIYNVESSSIPMISYCDIDGSGGSADWDTALGSDGGGNIDVDPEFVDADGADNTPGTKDDNLRLSPQSPCIDVGDNSVVDANYPDLDDNPRIVNAVVDMGAYEFSGPAYEPIVIYVSANATGSNNGSSWEDAFVSLQDALNTTIIADVIWVATGTYYPTELIDPCDPRTATFQMKNYVGIYGGFPDTGDPGMADRYPNRYETILSGDIGSPGESSDNCYHVFYHPNGTNLDSTAILDGFTITSGNADSIIPPHNYGGGIYNQGSSPMVINCTFAVNSAGIGGGGMYNTHYSNPTVTGCTLAGNSAGRWGGGMGNYFHCSPTVTNCTFSSNSAVSDFGGGMYNNYDSSPTVTGCTFTGNSTTYGGGIYNNNDSSPTVTKCTFSGNSTGYSGGGMHNAGSSPIVTNCTFTGNTTENGGGIYNYYFSSPTVTNCTFSANSANYGGGMHNFYESSPTVSNSILWGNTAASGGNEIALRSSSTIDVDFCDVQGGLAGIYDDLSGNTINWGSGNIDADPLFIDADGADNTPGTEDDNLRLQADSACIDAGDNSVVTTATDLDGNPRILDGDDDGEAIVDMGAYEFFYANTPPVANAGIDQIVYLCRDGAAEIELDGSGSTDADGDELEYLWTWEIEGALFDANGVSPIIELPVGLHTINLTVDDGVEESEPNSCVIEVLEGIEVDLRVMPRVINRKSRMKGILAVVELPVGIDEDDIDGSFWLYPGEIEPRFRHLMTVNGSQKLFMVFDKSELMAAVPANGAVVLEIEAQLILGRCLYGSDRIRIIRRGQGPREQTGLRKGTRSRRNRVQNSR